MKVMCSDDKLKVFSNYRAQLMGMAYRMLGNIAEAEDIVQETYISYHQQTEILNYPRTWLFKVCSRKCVDQLRKAYKQREVYPGPWLPEPVAEQACDWAGSSFITPHNTDSIEHWLTLSESLSTAFLLLLENLKPLERAVFLLHEIFDYPYREIGECLDKTPAYCRKIGQRARHYIQERKGRFQTEPEQAYPVIMQFFQTAKLGGLEDLKKLLAEDSEFWSDGGGRVLAARNILYGPERIAKFFMGISKQASEDIHYDIRPVLLYGQMGFLLYAIPKSEEVILDSLFSIVMDKHKIKSIYVLRNPDKLWPIQKRLLKA